jgi:hypothetical protein
MPSTTRPTSHQPPQRLLILGIFSPGEHRTADEVYARGSLSAQTLLVLPQARVTE